MALAQRRKTIPVNVGGVVIGGAAPIAVQTMTKTDTRDVRATLRQITKLKDAGCEIVRPAVPDHEAAEALKEIVKGSPLPVIADIHYDHTLALLAMRPASLPAPEPGQHPDRDKVIKVVTAAKERQIPFRIGVNAGSLPRRCTRSCARRTRSTATTASARPSGWWRWRWATARSWRTSITAPGYIKVSSRRPTSGPTSSPTASSPRRGPTRSTLA